MRGAGVGRATFYLHYADLEALAVDACADVVREAVDALHAWRGRPDPRTAPPALLAFFEGLPPHAPLYRALLSPGGGGPLGRVLHHDLRARSQAERELVGAPEAPLIASAVAATFAGVLADWLHGLIEATPEEIAAPGVAPARHPEPQPVASRGAPSFRTDGAPCEVGCRRQAKVSTGLIVLPAPMSCTACSMSSNGVLADQPVQRQPALA